MTHHILDWALIALFAPLMAAVITGFSSSWLSRRATYWTCCGLVGLSLVISILCFKWIAIDGTPIVNVNLYTWAVIDKTRFSIGFLIDQMTVLMMVVVTFVSFLVHVYSIGYMHEDDSYARFFSYISGFTFAMLSLVMANNFVMLFFGWEGVGLMSFLLIGFWYHKPAATFASLKAFIANRFGDLGLLLGMAVIVNYTGSIEYHTVFNFVQNMAPNLHFPLFANYHVNPITLMSILLFMGAVGKSAQIPLHVWLEGSMEGPTPISALIHAATMVTAGVFMLARISPIIELSTPALTLVLLLGAATCFFMGIIAIVQNDIKRVIAYSTLSQLGYMIAAQGASVYALGMFHLMTHAAFKALLFLAAGSVIVALHHEQDMRKMGGLAKKMPYTYICMLIGSLALVAIPPFSGFFSKDLIIEAVMMSRLPGYHFAAFCVVGGTFLTALYTFRMLFMVFHGKPRMSNEAYDHVKESPWSIVLPLVILAVPSIAAGWVFLKPALHGFFGGGIYLAPGHNTLAILAEETHSPWSMIKKAFFHLPFILSMLGTLCAFLAYIVFPGIPKIFVSIFGWLYKLIAQKYFIDILYERFFIGLAQSLGSFFWLILDAWVIDKAIVEGTAKTTKHIGDKVRKAQTGYLYHYLFFMLIGLIVPLIWVFSQAKF